MMSMRVFQVALLFFLFAVAPLSAHAQVARVAIFGDSLAEGVAMATKSLPDNQPVLQLTKVGWGFNSPGAQTHVQNAARQMRRLGIKRVLVLVGTNDVGAAFPGADGKSVAFSNPAWPQAYARQLIFLVQNFRAAGVEVVWLGIPTMQDPEREAGVRRIEGITRAVAARGRMPFLALAPVLAKEEKQNPPGALRGKDGVHLTMGGYRALATYLAFLPVPGPWLR